MAERPDNVSHASLNGIYVKAQELDRGHNRFAAPSFAPPGDANVDALSNASDVVSHASDAETHASDYDVVTHPS